MCSSTTEAIYTETEPIREFDKVADVYIAVFFDGTGNNMVQQALYETFNKKVAKNRERVLPDGENASPEQIASYSQINKLREEIQNIETLIAINNANLKYYFLRDNAKQSIKRLRKEKIEKLHELEKLQIEAHIDAATMSADTKNSYSNIAILHSFQEKKQKADSLFYNIYVEGSGAENLAYIDSGWFADKVDEYGGLGFGVGIKGVASLTMKGCDYVYRYLSPLKGRLNENTKYHFFVFGFSRGATCARLFAQLVTRTEGNTLPCESELCCYSKECIKNGRIAFMEHNFLSERSTGEGSINRKNVNVDFLGIYDTVASIGILKQKDGFINALKDTLEKCESTKEWTSKFHYKNANDYGLYINLEHTKNLFHICAADEYRENFALVNIGDGISNGAEMIIPGCHSDVGGSYVDYSGNKERVLYRFIPRKVKHKRFKFNLSKEEIDKIGFLDPIDTKGEAKPLNAIGLGEMGWIDPIYAPKKEIIIKPTEKKELYINSDERKIPLFDISQRYISKNSALPPTMLDLINPVSECKERKLKQLEDVLNAFYDKMFYLDAEFKHRCTGRYADSAEGDNRCVKFIHNAMGYYSNIPLRMMLARFKKKINDYKLFDENLVKDFFKFPKDLENFGKEFEKRASEIEDGKREWITVDGGYFSESYRRLRMKYIHFTASCQIFNWNLNSFLECDWANFGNECNYDETGKICRIMYLGNKGEIDSANDGVNYMVANNRATPFKHVQIPLGVKESELYSKPKK